MAIDQAVTRWSVEGRHVVCQRCGETFTYYGRDGGGCPHCEATRQAEAKLCALESVKTAGTRSEWWLAIPFGTKAYDSPEKVANGRPIMDVGPGVYKWVDSERTWKGYAVHIGTSERFGEIWVLQTIQAGVYARKSRDEAERIMQEMAA